MKQVLLIITSLLLLSFQSASESKETVHLVIFEGSDWCVNCNKLEQSILADTGFQSFLKAQNIIIEKVDFPQRKKQNKETLQYNKEMAERFGFKGVFPSIYLTKENENKTIVYSNSMTVQSLQSTIEKYMQQLP